MSDKKERALIEIVLKGSAANAAIKDIDKAVRALGAQLRSLPKDSQAFADKKAEFQKMSKSLKDLQNDVKGVGGVFQSIGKEIKGFGIMAAGYLGFQWLSSSITGIIKQNAELSDSLADIRKTTGLTEDEAKKMNTAFGQIDTRTAAKDLRAIAIVGGQLGIAKQDIFGFTVAVDKMNVALGDEFSGGAEEITKVMGGLRNVFTDIKSDKVDQDLLHIGNAINELSARGAATGPVVADFANRIGGVGITLGLTSGQVLGLSATLQELNVSTERGGTAISRILQKMAGNVGDFYQVAKSALDPKKNSLKDFTEMVNKDLYGAFVKVAEGSKNSGVNAVAFSKILDTLGVEGAGASEVFAKLGNNTAMLNEKVEIANGSLKGTNSILAEFNIKNRTMGADLEVIAKGFASWFTNSAVSGFFKSITSGLAEMLSKTPEAEKLTDAWRNQKASVENLEASMVPLLNRHDELKGKATLNKEEQAELDKIIAKVAETIPFAVTEFDKYGKAMDINTTKGRDFLRMEEQKLELMNKDALTSRRQELIEYSNEIARFQAQLRNRDKDGDLFQTIKTKMDGIGEKSTYVFADVKLTNEEIIKLNQNLLAAKDKQLGVFAIINELTGKVTATSKEVVKAKEDEAAAAIESAKEQEEAMKKLLDARKKYLEDLEKIEQEFKGRNLTGPEKEEKAIFDKYDKLLEKEKKGSAVYQRLMFMRETEVTEFQKKEADKYLKVRKDLEQKIEDVTLPAMQKELNAINKKYDDLKRSAQQYGIDTRELELFRNMETSAVRAKYDEKEIADNKSKYEKMSKDDKAYHEKKQATFNDYYQAVNQIISAWNETQKNQAEVRTEQIKQNTTADLAMNKRLYENKVIGQNEYNARAKKLEEKSRKEISAVKKRAAENDKKIAIFNALINAGMTISRAFKDYQYPASIIIAALAGGAAMMQVSAISSQKVPEYAKGGLHQSDKPAGFVDKPTYFTNSSSGRDFIAGEAGKEWIAPNWMLDNPYTANTIEMLEAIRTRGYASGGSNSVKQKSNPQGTAPTAAGASQNDTMMQFIAVMSSLNTTLKTLQENGLEAYMPYDKFNNTVKSFETAKNSAQVKT